MTAALVRTEGVSRVEIASLTDRSKALQITASSSDPGRGTPLPKTLSDNLSQGWFGS